MTSQPHHLVSSLTSSVCVMCVTLGCSPCVYVHIIGYNRGDVKGFVPVSVVAHWCSLGVDNGGLMCYNRPA